MPKIRTRFLILTMVVLVVAAAIATAVYAASRGGPGGVPAGTEGGQGSISITNCKAGKSDFITNDTTGLSTTSTTYVPVPGMTKTVTISGHAPSCLLVDVSGFAFAPGAALEFVGVTVDGNLGAANFAFQGVSPGAHSVAMVFRSNSGATVFLHRPAMQIDHK
jgi:hypothetical protein